MCVRPMMSALILRFLLIKEKEQENRSHRCPPLLLFDELGDGRLIVGGEETNEVDSVGQAADIDGIPLFS